MTTDPRTVLPFKNCTEPVAMAGAIVAVSVTAWPNVEVDRLSASVAVVDALFTVC